jgi:transcriptional regulator with XRE-family HTH domain
MEASGRPETPGERAAAPHAWFVAELLRRRMIAGLSQGDLGALMGYDRTYVNKVERGAVEPTGEFAGRADATLGARGELLGRWEAFDAARRGRPSARRPAPSSSREMVTDVVVERDEAWVTLLGGGYGLRVRKRIANVGEAPVTRFFVRIWVGGRPGALRPERGRRTQAPSPEELGLRAWCADEPMTLDLMPDRGVTRELCLLFRNAHGQFPLYPGQEATVEYAYRVAAERWGRWFERSVRLPTGWLGVHLAFAEGLDPSVWGVEVPPAAADRPFAAPIRRESAAGEARFHWSTARPPLQARYRLEWRFRAERVEGGR